MKTGSMLAIVLFALVALAHLVRVILGWEVTVAGEIIPQWVSVIGVLVPGTLASMLWKEAD